ncbi:MAG: amidohydrolase [Gammaproteobacteria bacterium]|nr:amidohydrolase [Gammaproteobacteria bacterium]
MRFVVSLVTVIVGFAGCMQAPQGADPADFVFRNGRVYTVDAAMPWAEAVAVRDDRIVYVGGNAGAAVYVGDATEQIDLGGKLLLPGFIDSHMHLIDERGLATALSLQTESGSIQGWVQEIADYAAANPTKEVVFGYGFMASAFGAEGPTRQLIDAVVPDRPVLIIDEGLHSAWVNTAALTRLNITRDTPDPVPGFSYYKRDADGNATGFLLEDTANQAMTDLEVATAEAVARGTAIIIDLLNQNGVTSVFDAGAFSAGAADIDAVLAGLETQGALTVRIVGSMFVLSPGQIATAVQSVEAMRQSVRGDHYHYNTLKILNDGTIEGRTAAMFEDYRGEGIEPGNAGSTVFSETELVEMISGAAERGIDVHIHALGERAVHESLNAIEAVRKIAPHSESRYTLTHIQVVTDQDVPRFAELDVIAQSTPLWATYDTYGKEFISEDQFQRYFRFKSIEDAGGRLAFGSDFPASGAGVLGLSPLVQIELGHTRHYPGDPDSPLQPRASERLSIASLVRGFTLGAAYQLHMEDQIGSVEVGKKADLVVLDQDIFEIDPFTIHKTGVLMTMLDGTIVYRVDN